MKWYEDIDLSEILCFLLLGLIVAMAASNKEWGIVNTISGIIGGYMVKAVKNGVTEAIKKPKVKPPKVEKKGKG